MAEQDPHAHDHKKLGREFDLFAFSDTVGKGLPLWTQKGTAIRRELERFIVDEEVRRGYSHVYTPDIAKLALYEKSGHYPHYKKDMFPPINAGEDGETFMLRPMTCPHHFELFLARPRSYRDLPMRIAEVAKLYRYEQSGELMGLQRVLSFCLSDAHIICASEEQAVDEIGKALDLIEYTTGVLGLVKGREYWFRLSLGDRNNTEKYYQNDAAWEKGESLLRSLLQSRGGEFVEAKNEAAFYGPKIDIQMKNVNGKEDTAFTVQYDFCMPDRFELDFTAEDGALRRAFVVHRSSIGSLERTIAFLIEHYSGAFPAWLSPIQTMVLPVATAHDEYAAGVALKLREAGIRVEISKAEDTLGKRIRNAKIQKVPYLLVMGDKEVSAGSVSVESRDNGAVGAMPLEAFLASLLSEVKNRDLKSSMGA